MYVFSDGFKSVQFFFARDKKREKQENAGRVLSRRKRNEAKRATSVQKQHVDLSSQLKTRPTVSSYYFGSLFLLVLILCLDMDEIQLCT